LFGFRNRPRSQGGSSSCANPKIAMMITKTITMTIAKTILTTLHAGTTFDAALKAASRKVAPPIREWITGRIAGFAKWLKRWWAL
jgi:hypothetical protein